MLNHLSPAPSKNIGDKKNARLQPKPPRIDNGKTWPNIVRVDSAERIVVNHNLQVHEAACTRNHNRMDHYILIIVDCTIANQHQLWTTSDRVVVIFGTRGNRSPSSTTADPHRGQLRNSFWIIIIRNGWLFTHQPAGDPETEWLWGDKKKLHVYNQSRPVLTREKHDQTLLALIL